jgi:hypothetical protein
MLWWYGNNGSGKKMMYETDSVNTNQATLKRDQNMEVTSNL